MAELVVIDKSDLAKLVQREFRLVISDVLKNARPVSSELMTKKELAVYLRCDVSKINRYMKKDMPFEMFGDTPRFRKSAIDKWLKKE